MDFRKRNLVLAMLAALCAVEAAIAADKPDFTGEWILNISKSTKKVPRRRTLWVTSKLP